GRRLVAIDALALGGGPGPGLDLPGKLRLHVQPDRVSVDVATLPQPAAPRLGVRACPGCADPGAAHLRPGMDLSVGYRRPGLRMRPLGAPGSRKHRGRSEEHTSELQSLTNIVCRLLLEKKKK